MTREWPACNTCPYWFEPHASAVLGVCRRFPPQAVFLGMMPSPVVGPNNEQLPPQPVIRGAFPTCGRNDCCGEHPAFQATVPAPESVQ